MRVGVPKHHTDCTNVIYDDRRKYGCNKQQLQMICQWIMLGFCLGSGYALRGGARDCPDRGAAFPDGDAWG